MGTGMRAENDGLLRIGGQCRRERQLNPKTQEEWRQIFGIDMIAPFGTLANASTLAARRRPSEANTKRAGV